MIKPKKDNSENQNCCSRHVSKLKHYHNPPQSSAIYGLGVIGALFYFLQSAATFSAVIVGIFKSIFWPAFVIFKVLTILEI